MCGIYQVLNGWYTPHIFPTQQGSMSEMPEMLSRAGPVCPLQVLHTISVKMVECEVV